MLITAVMQFPPLPTFADLRARLLTFDAQQSLTALMASLPPPQAFYSAHSHPKRSGHPRGSRGTCHGSHFPCFSGSTRPIFSSSNQPHSWSYCSSQPSTSVLAPLPISRIPLQCWTCHQFGRVVARCLVSSRDADLSPHFADMHISQPSDPNWYLDSSTTNHMTNDARALTNVSNSSDQVLVGNGASLPITHSGTVAFSSGSYGFKLPDLLLVPSLHKNLLSIAQFAHDHPVSITSVSWGYIIRHLHTGAILFQGRCSDGLYPVLPSLAPKFKAHSKFALSSTVSSSSLWHRRLGHPSNKVLRTLVSQSLLGSHFNLSHNSCSHCALVKSVRLSFSSYEHCSSEPFHLIHSDVWMSPVVSFSGFRYYVLFTDDFTRFSWIFPMCLKSEVFHHFSTFVSYVETQFSMSVKQFQSDGGKEFDNGNFKQFCASKGIIHRFSCPHTPQQNGLAKRKHHHIADMGRTLFLTANLPHSFSVEAFCTAVYLINRLPTPLLKWKTPYRCLFHTNPDFSLIRTFGCTCYPYLGANVSNKL